MKTIDAARGKWQEILVRLGIDERFLRDSHGPCPVCGGKDRWRFDNKNGNGTWYCHQCVPRSGNGLNLLMAYHGWDFATTAKEVDAIVGNCSAIEQRQEVKKDPRIRLKKIQKGLKPIDGINPVSIYLKNRGLPKSACLSFHPRQPYYDAKNNNAYLGSFPAMVAVFKSPEGTPLTFHLTYLTAHGTKADLPSAKKVMPGIAKLHGGAIRLFDPAKVMGIAEGIETALACYKLFKVPTWAAYSSSLLEKFVPPPECEHLIVFGDNDTNYAGHKAGYALANRLAVKGMSVEVRMANSIGADWADEIKEHSK